MALYHTHRPQTFDSVIGQEHVVETLKQQILNNSLAHAYLFSGPRGVGKTTTARILAKAVNCPRKKGSAEPDNESECAREINESRCIDVIEIDAASHTGVDNVRQNIIENAQFKPTTCNKKVFIIDEVHMLSTAAFNALLKTLEEPPEHVLFILATTELHKLPVTIVSRCQRFAFKRVSTDIIEQHLKNIAKKEDVGIDEEVLRRIAQKSEGCVRDAVSLFDQITSLGKKKITLSDIGLILPSTSCEQQLAFLSTLLNNNAKESFSIIEDVINDGVYIERFMEELIELARYMMIYFVDPTFVEQALTMNQKDQTLFEQLVRTPKADTFVALIDLLIKRKQQISSSPVPELPLQMLVIEWTHQSNMMSGSQNAQPSKEVLKDVPASPKAATETASGNLPKQSEKIEKESKKEIAVASKSIDTKTLRTAWPKVIAEIEKTHPSLGTLLKMVEVCDVRGQELIVATPYSFHKEKLTQNPCKNNLETVMESVVGARLTLRVQLNESAQQEQHNADIKELASAFGGEVIN